MSQPARSQSTKIIASKGANLRAHASWEAVMSEDKRDVLEVLRYELNFIEQGGYGNWYSTPWGPASIFQDSLTCPNHGDPTRPHACHECLLYDFVPEQYRNEDVPCHHIPLNKQGDNIAQPPQSEEELRENVKHWLKRTIARIEAERAKENNGSVTQEVTGAGAHRSVPK